MELLVGAMVRVRVCFGTAEGEALATGFADKARGRTVGALDGAGERLLVGRKVGKRVGRDV